MSLVGRSPLSTKYLVGVVTANGRNLSRLDQLLKYGDDELLSSENSCPGTMRSGVSSGLLSCAGVECC